jgi:phosphate starvation-inducible PhoH-like protein
MNEKTFILETIHPSALYGRNNPFLPLITKAFPQLKIVARGEQIKVQGPPEHIARFEEKLDCLVNIYERKTAPVGREHSFCSGRSYKLTYVHRGRQ